MELFLDRRLMLGVSPPAIEGCTQWIVDRVTVFFVSAAPFREEFPIVGRHLVVNAGRSQVVRLVPFRIALSGAAGLLRESVHFLFYF